MVNAVCTDKYYYDRLTEACAQHKIVNPFTMDMLVDAGNQIMPYILVMYGTHVRAPTVHCVQCAYVAGPNRLP
jgi:hypothetical protein